MGSMQKQQLFRTMEGSSPLVDMAATQIVIRWCRLGQSICPVSPLTLHVVCWCNTVAAGGGCRI